MGRVQNEFTKCHNNSLIKIAPFLFGLASLLILVQNYEFAFSQTGDEFDLESNASNVATNGSSHSPMGFVANGKINSLVSVPNGKWLAAGNWSITLNSGNVTDFETKMTWYNSSGTNAHTHEITNFKSVSDNGQALPVSASSKQTVIKGISDVGANGKVSWFEVPTTITINDGKIISISVDDTKTNHHFGGQPLLGIVDSFASCSDLPGPNMELLPPCTPSGLGEQDFPSSDGFTPFQGSSPNGEFPQQGFPSQDQGFPSQDQGFPSQDFQQGFPSQDFQQGFPSQDFQSEDDQTGLGLPTQGFPGGEFPSDDDQTGSSEDDESGPELEPGCNELDIENITASGFESDPSDYHPPSDAIDDDSSTWWSNNGRDPWIEVDLGNSQSICGITVQWNKGEQRDYSFKVEVSDDGSEYKKVFEGDNKKGSSELEAYPFEDSVSGQYIKLTITDTSSKDGWASIQEISALGL